MVDNRLQRIYDVASRLFIKPGYSQTQIDTIAKASGISVGAIYDLISGKKTMLKFILKCTIDPTFIESDFELPIDEDLFTGLNDEIIIFLDKNIKDFSRPLSTRLENYQFEQMLSDFFDIVHNYGVLMLILENNPSVLRIFDNYIGCRKKFFEVILQYTKRYIEQGTVRKLQSPELSVMFIIEAIARWGMHIKYDSFKLHEGITDADAKAVCMDALLKSYKA